MAFSNKTLFQKKHKKIKTLTTNKINKKNLQRDKFLEEFHAHTSSPDNKFNYVSAKTSVPTAHNSGSTVIANNY